MHTLNLLERATSALAPDAGTGIHAALLAPADVTLHRHESGNGHHRRQDPLSLQLSDYSPDTTVVLFPEDKVGWMFPPELEPGQTG